MDFPDRVWAAEVGFLSTWWVGLIAGWLVGRLVVPSWPGVQVWRVAARAFSVMLGCSLVCGILGALIQPDWYGGGAAWEGTAQLVGITSEELPDFILVAHIHQGGYAGAVLGLAAVLLWLRQQGKRPVPENPNG